MIKGLYLVIGHEPDDNLLTKVQAALQGGAQAVQYRGKSLTQPEQIATARRVGEICRQYDATFLVNDLPELAREVGADGIHIGQEDLSVTEARKELGPDKLIGISTKTVDQAIKAEMQGADYIGVGSIYPTQSKQDTRVIGLRTLSKIRKAVKIPIAAIGGINSNNADAILEAGADAVAVISAINADPRPEVAARELSLLFNRRMAKSRARVLSVAGSDSGGGAGIQADLKTISLLGSYGMTAVTALTAQNTLGVKGIYPASAGFVASQMEAVLDDIGADMVKTGMLFSAEIVSRVAAIIGRHQLLSVVDPVMVAKGGAALLKRDVMEALKQDLIPLTYLLAPNIPEAEALTGKAVRSAEEMEAAARTLQQMGARHVLIKGGHLSGEALDLLLAGDTAHWFPAKRLDNRNTHGTGCTFASAIATFLAQGLSLVAATALAKQFITAAIRTAQNLGTGHGPVNHYQAAFELAHPKIEKPHTADVEL